MDSVCCRRDLSTVTALVDVFYSYLPGDALVDTVSQGHCATVIRASALRVSDKCGSMLTRR